MKERRDRQLNRTRQFGLNIEDCKTPEEKKYYKKALKAYLKGRKKFRHGYTTLKGKRVPAYFNTPIK